MLNKILYKHLKYIVQSGLIVKREREMSLSMIYKICQPKNYFIHASVPKPNWHDWMPPLSKMGSDCAAPHDHLCAICLPNFSHMIKFKPNTYIIPLRAF